MSMQWPSHVERSLRPLSEGQVSRELVAECMRGMRTALLALEVSPRETESCLSRILDELPELPADSAQVRAVFDLALQRVAGMKPVMLPFEAAARHDRRWDLKELHNRMRRCREEDWTPATPLFRRPMMERVPRNLDLRRSRKFRLTDNFVDVDFVPEMNREKVDRLVRGLGKGMKDFGPEPPTGGSPARV